MEFCIENINYTPSKIIVMYNNDVFEVDFTIRSIVDDITFVITKLICFEFNIPFDKVNIQTMNQDSPEIIEGDTILLIKLEGY
jgi:hypothetical protein